MASILEKAYRGKRVLVTGHTGFKGSWLLEWLLSLGAVVRGYALDPQPHEILYDQLGLADRIDGDYRGNLADRESIAKLIDDFRPEVIFHLAAQPLVRLSYDIPVETFATNIMGTAHVLDGIRQAKHPCAVVAVTTDKCYDNREWLHGYREEDPMGGSDPYSASKGAAELVIASFRRSFFSDDGPIKVASSRAGNVIGGGDWAVDRIVPDCIRAIRSANPVPIRNRTATRPWQHVLEPLSGYLWLGALLSEPHLNPLPSRGQSLCSAFNFGPPLGSNHTVAHLVSELIRHMGGQWICAADPSAPHEASKLNLATDKAFHLLGWEAVWTFEETVQHTADWYVAEHSGNDVAEYTRNQIAAYEQAAIAKRIPWAFSC